MSGHFVWSSGIHIYSILCKIEDAILKLTEYEDKVAQAEAEKEQAEEKVYSTCLKLALFEIILGCSFMLLRHCCMSEALDNQTVNNLKIIQVFIMMTHVGPVLSLNWIRVWLAAD